MVVAECMVVWTLSSVGQPIVIVIVAISASFPAVPGKCVQFGASILRRVHWDRGQTGMAVAVRWFKDQFVEVLCMRCVGVCWSGRVGRRFCNIIAYFVRCYIVDVLRMEIVRFYSQMTGCWTRVLKLKKINISFLLKIEKYGVLRIITHILFVETTFSTNCSVVVRFCI